MSTPYGQSSSASTPSSPTPGSALDLSRILALATAGLGLVVYFFSFSDKAFGYLWYSVIAALLLGGGLLAATAALPRPTRVLAPAAVIVVTGTLGMLAFVVKGDSVGLGDENGDTPGIMYFVLVLAFLEAIAVVAALLADAGLLKAPARKPKSSQSWGGGPPSGGFPAGQYGQQPGQYGQQPGQGQYGGQPGQQAQPGQYGGQPGQYGGQPGQSGQYGGQPGQQAQPGQYGGQPGQPGQYGGQQPPAQPTQQFPTSPPSGEQPPAQS